MDEFFLGCSAHLQNIEQELTDREYDTDIYTYDSIAENMAIDFKDNVSDGLETLLGFMKSPGVTLNDSIAMIQAVIDELG